jgi:hypothetical protein
MFRRMTKSLDASFQPGSGCGQACGPCGVAGLNCHFARQTRGLMATASGRRMQEKRARCSTAPRLVRWPGGGHWRVGRTGPAHRGRVQGKLDNSKTRRSSERAHSRPHSAVVPRWAAIGHGLRLATGSLSTAVTSALTRPAHFMTTAAIDAHNACNSPTMRSPS